MAAPTSVVLIHGLYMTPESWEPWVQRYRERGLEVHAPAWPGITTVAEMQADPSAIAGLGIATIAESYERFVRGLPSAPILIGHSIGGLVVQLLLDRGLGAAGVAIHPAPPKGVRKVPLVALRASWPILKSPGNRKRTVAPTDKGYHFGFANDLTLAEAAAERARLAIPATGRALFDVAMANTTRKSPTTVDFRRSGRAPLLLTTGELDHLVPPSVTRSNLEKYRKSDGVVELKEYPGRSHGTFAHAGWEAVADDALDWALAHAG